jgi:hypothetical protein
MKKYILWVFSFVCFATFMVQNLPAHGHKTEKQRSGLNSIIVTSQINVKHCLFTIYQVVKLRDYMVRRIIGI